jgi:outer membrane cobalamin receptor
LYANSVVDFATVPISHHDIARDSLSSSTQNLGISEIRAKSISFAEQDPDYLEIRTEAWEGKSFALADVLAEQAGIQAHRLGGMGSFQTVSIRGAAAKSVLICMDDIPLEDAGGGATNLGGIDLNQIEKIEIYKTYAPARFGGNGMGGVINFVTREKIKTGGRILASYGSHNAQELAASFLTKLSDSLRFSSEIAYRHSDNDYEFTNRNGTEYNTEDDREEKRQNAQYTQMSGTHALRLIHSNGAHSTLTVSHTQESGGNPGKEDNQTVIAGFDRDMIQSLYLWGKWQTQAGVSGRIEKSVSHSYYPLDKIGYVYNSYMEYGSISYLARPELALLLNPDNENRNLSAGIYVKGGVEYLEPRDNNKVSSTYHWDLSRRFVDVAGESSFSPLSFLSFGWDASVRGTQDEKSKGILYSPTSQDTLSTEHAQKLLWAARTSLRLGKETSPVQGFASIARYYRAPQLMELYGVRQGVLSNPDLKPEEGLNWEAGVHLKSASKKSSLQLLYFETHSRNGIQWVTSASFTKPLNISKALTRGVEMELLLQPLSFWESTLRGTLQNPRDLSNASVYHDNQLPEEPVKSGSFQNRFYLPLHFELSLKTEWRSRIFSDRANRKEIPSQALFHASLAWQAPTKTRLIFAVNNITDEEYQDIYASYPKPGREFKATLTQEF